MTRAPFEQRDDSPAAKRKGYWANFGHVVLWMVALGVFGLLIALLPGTAGVVVGIVLVSLLAWLSGRRFWRH
jgi:hypothetical protein